MPDESLVMTLAKVLIAAAWADGEINQDEINSLKDLLFNLPEVGARHWDELNMYIETPVGEEERARLIGELRQQISSAEGQRLALETLNRLINADGIATGEERTVAREIKQAIHAADTGIIGAFSRLSRNLRHKRSEALAHAPNREAQFDDYVKNKVYYNLRLRQRTGSGQAGETIPDLSDKELRRLGLAGGLLARVARIDENVTADEKNVMRDALLRYWDLKPAEATLVIEVAVSDEAQYLDFFRLSREFGEHFSYDESLKMARALFAVAAADGDISFEETEEIRSIASGIKLNHQEFINAKLHVLGKSLSTA
jgi:uncharacterized tellurite resistance protein B-like protein